MVMVRPRLRRLLARAWASPASINTEQCVTERAKAVLCIVTGNGACPLTPKEVEFCNEACIVRVLKAKGNHVSKAAKQLRATLTWRANFDIDHLTADEFSAELAQGTAYVAGHDQFGQPVLIARLQPESLSNTSQKRFLRYMAFCMEVAMGSISPTVEQCVLIFDASGLKKATQGLSLIVQVLKMLGEHYPDRIARTFVVDPPPMFYMFWKGLGKFLDLKTREKLKFVFSKDYNAFRVTSSKSSGSDDITRGGQSCSNRSLWEADEQRNDLEEESKGIKRVYEDCCEAPNCPPTLNTLNSQAQTPASSSGRKITTLAFLLSSSSFSVASSATASVPMPSSLALPNPTKSTSQTSTLLPSMLSTSTSSTLNRPASGGPALLSDKNQARSHSFASTLAYRKEDVSYFQSFRADTRARRGREEGSSRRWADLAFAFSKKEDFSVSSADTAQKDKPYALFMPYYAEFLSKPYSEADYRVHMKPPLAGLISILGPDIQLRQPSFSLHKCKTVEAMLHHLYLD